MDVSPREEPHPHVVTVELGEADLRGFLQWRLWHFPGARQRYFRRWHILLLAALACSVGVLLLPLPGERWLASSVLLAAALLGPLFHLREGPRQMARAIVRQAHPALKPVTWRLTRAGLEATAGEGSSLREWVAIGGCHATHELLLFTVGRTAEVLEAIVLPRRSFSSPAASQKFFETARGLWETSSRAPAGPPTPEQLDRLLGSERIEGTYHIEFTHCLWVQGHELLVQARYAPLAFLVLALTATLVGYCVSFVAGAVAGVGLALLLAVGVPIVQAWFSAKAVRRLAGRSGRHWFAASPHGLLLYHPDSGTGHTGWRAFRRL
jgi:hypothetical protein